MAKVYVGIGHGGSDPGAVSGNHKEAAYALDIGTACAAELRRNGVSVMQSRTSNVTEKLAIKIDECNRYNPSLAVDIHLNAGGGDGFEVFYGKTDAKSRTLGQKIETAVKAIGQNSRGLKIKLNNSGKDYFGFIRQTKCTAVLVECAFIDSKDVQIVDTKAERERMGVAIARGILAYLGIGVKATASGGTSKKAVYRVRKSWTDVKSQIGAYESLANAKAAADKNPGYKVFDPAGKKVYPTAAKSVTAIAKEVIAGKWGNGSERKARLTAAGYNYATVQKEVNRLLK